MMIFSPILKLLAICVYLLLLLFFLFYVAGYIEF